MLNYNQFPTQLSLLLLVVLISLPACHPAPASKTTLAFYYWQTQLQLSETEQDYLNQLQPKRLYIKFFDVDWDQGNQIPIPLATLDRSTSAPLDQLEIVPTIFITNRCFKQIDPKKLDWFVEKTFEKIQQLWEQFPEHNLREVQFDCDWTASTTDLYFRFLEKMRQLGQIHQFETSATIRLHQITYAQKTGIPPVNRGMLMFYNTDDLQDWETPNSILHLETASFYLNNAKDYPLTLDIALPIFSWGVVFRQQKLIRLINNLNAAQLQDTAQFIQLTPNRFELKKSTYLNSYYLYAGDQIRTESITPTQLLDASDLLKKWLPPSDRFFTYYHLDSTTVKQYPYAQLEQPILHFKQE